MRSGILLLFVLAVVAVVVLSGCARGGEMYPEQVWSHIEHHIYVSFKGAEEIHKFIDKHLFNLDIEDPDSYY